MAYQKTNRKNNEKKVFSYLFQNEKFTITQISTQFNLSFPTAKSIINKFLEDGILIKLNNNSTSIGRRSQLYTLNPNSKYSIGVKVELNKLVIILTNLKAQIIKRFDYQESLVNNNDILDNISSKLEDFIFDIDSNIKKDIIGIGISLPGIIEKESLIFKIGTNFKIHNIDFNNLKKKLGYNIFLENEANVGAICEAIIGNAKHNKNFNFISIGTGIGLGQFFNGTLYKGSCSMAGEIGHISIDLNGLKCNCGGNGCWELYASDISFFNLFKKSFPKIKTYNEIFNEDIVKEDKWQELFDTYIKYLAIGIKNILVINNPEKIIIGGNIVKYRDFFEKKLKNLVFENNIFYSENSILEFSKYNDDSNLLGASLLPIIDKFF